MKNRQHIGPTRLLLALVAAALTLVAGASSPAGADSCRKAVATTPMPQPPGADDVAFPLASFFVGNGGYGCAMELEIETSVCSHDQQTPCQDSFECEAIQQGSFCLFNFDDEVLFVHALCEPGEFVQGGTCLGAGAQLRAEAVCCISPCGSNADCDHGVCGGLGSCVECEADGDCDAGRFCEREACHVERIDGAACTRDGQCGLGVCTGGACGP